MAMKNIGKPNLNSNMKTGLRTLTKATPKRANVVGEIASNHTILRVRGGGKSPSGGGPKKKTRMY